MGVVTIYRNKNRTEQKNCKKFFTHFSPLPTKQHVLSDSSWNDLPVFLARSTSCQLDDVASMRKYGASKYPQVLANLVSGNPQNKLIFSIFSGFALICSLPCNKICYFWEFTSHWKRLVRRLRVYKWLSIKGKWSRRLLFISSLIFDMIIVLYKVIFIHHKADPLQVMLFNKYVLTYGILQGCGNLSPMQISFQICRWIWTVLQTSHQRTSIRIVVVLWRSFCTFIGSQLTGCVSLWL